MIARLMAGQFREPAGWLGRLVGNRMARGNAYEIGWTVTLLDIQPDDRVLEVGFGPGVGIGLAAERATQGMVAGVDLSQTMVQVAAKRNAAAAAVGRVALRQGDVGALPYDDGVFDKVFAIHCLYFWPQPAAAAQELRRVLKSGGVVALTILPKERWERTPPADVFTLYSADEVERMLGAAGFREISVAASPQPDQFPGVCILAVK